MSEHKLLLQSSPHVRDVTSVHGIMHTVILSLVPALVAGVVFFGWRALAVTVVAVVACMAMEALILRLAGKPVKNAMVDGSAIITGLLLAMNLPSNIPFWMVGVGAVVAIGVAKHAYGGLGNNPFNPALVARVFMLIAFPGAMTSWPVTTFGPATDVLTAATPLGVMKMEGAAAALQSASWWDLFIGNVGGSLGETSALALLLGGLFLLWRKVISYEIPLAFIGTVAIGTAIAWAVDPTRFPDPLWQVLSGGVMLGAWFMATDMVTSPVTRRGMLVFGMGCGVVTCVIRLLGSYPEGVSFSILIMNGLTPLIDRYVKPVRFGSETAQAEGSKA